MEVLHSIAGKPEESFLCTAHSYNKTLAININTIIGQKRII